MKGDLIPGLKFLGEVPICKGTSPFFFFKENRRDCSLTTSKNDTTLFIPPFIPP